MTQKMIRKRDGRLVEFHTEKIRNAIWRSFLGVGQTGMEDVSDALARKVETMLELEGCEPEVEHVQDLVEQVLMQEGYGRTAKAYILYREERSRARQVNSSLMRRSRSRMPPIRTSSAKTPTSTATPPWAPCCATAPRPPSSSPSPS